MIEYLTVAAIGLLVTTALTALAAELVVQHRRALTVVSSEYP